MSGQSGVTSGYWRQVAAVVDGERIDVGSGAVLKIDDSGYVVTVNGKVYQRGTSSSNTNITPYQSDVTVSEGPQAGLKIPQIFQVQGDFLLACQSQPDAPRPTEFTSVAGSGHTLSVWLRISDEEAQQSAFGGQNWAFWTLFLVALGFADGIRKDLEHNLGYWPGLIITGLSAAALVTLVSLILKWGWRRGLVLGVTMSSGYFTFEELKPVLGPVLGNLGAGLVAACTAFVLAALVHRVLSAFLKTRWN